MRELLITIIFLSAVSSEEYEPKKRLEIPPEEDPNFWPTRGRRSYWSSPGLIGHLIHRNPLQGPEVDYAGFPRSWGSQDDLSSPPELLGASDSWKFRLCPRKKLTSLVLPLEEYRPDDTELLECGRWCTDIIQGRGRRRDERWRRQQPLYVEEPKWITIDHNQGLLAQHSMGAEDPFIVARGKKRNDDIVAFRERRQLEDVLKSYDTDPFFVARGRRNIKKEDSGSEKESFEAHPTNEFDSKPRGRRGSDPEDKNVGKFEEGKASSTEDRKFPNTRPRKRPEDDEKPFLTDRGVVENHHHLRTRRSSSSSSSPSSASSTDHFQPDENKWIISNDRRVSDAEGSEEFSLLNPRYSRPRDKHSNLQNILDEPFFVSRGKKKAAAGVGYLRYNNNRGGEGDGEPPVSPIKMEEAAAADAREILKNIYRAGGALRVAYDAAISTAPKSAPLFPAGDDLELLFKRSKPYNKPPRNRRGMLDDLLKDDDPFYVARGKKSYPENRPRYFDYFSKKTRTKLLRKLSDESGEAGSNKPNFKGGRDFWNLTINAINDIN